MVASTLERASANILVVEDEAEISDLISLLLLRQGHQVQQCVSAVEAIDQLKKKSFDLIVLDWMLPYMSGLDLLKNFPIAKIPVLMVTAKSAPADIVAGLEAGADDYITKPFDPIIFTARINALLRRIEKKSNESEASGELLKIEQLELNFASHQVKCQSELVHLTPSEFKILSTLAMNSGRVLTRDQLIQIVQGEGISVTGRTVDTHVFGLRKKMGVCGGLIETIRGVGYRVMA